MGISTIQTIFLHEVKKKHGWPRYSSISNTSPYIKKIKLTEVALFELQVFKILSCLNIHEKHVAL